MWYHGWIPDALWEEHMATAKDHGCVLCVARIGGKLC